MGASGINPSSGVKTAQKSTTDNDCETLAIATNNTTAAASKDESPPPSKPKYIPVPPKSSRKFARKKWGNKGDRKRSSYDHEGAKEVLGLDETANDQQIISAILREFDTTIPTPPSPNKKEVKRENKKLKATVDSLEKAHVAKDRKIASKDKKINSQQDVIKDLTEQLRIEKKVSRELIEKAWEDTEDMMNESSVVMDVAKAKEKEVEDRILHEKESCGKAMRRERRISSRQIAQMKSKQEAAMKKLHDEHDAVLRVNEQNYDKEKVRVCECLVSFNCCFFSHHSACAVLQIIPLHYR